MGSIVTNITITTTGTAGASKDRGFTRGSSMETSFSHSGITGKVLEGHRNVPEVHAHPSAWIYSASTHSTARCRGIVGAISQPAVGGTFGSLLGFRLGRRGFESRTLCAKTKQLTLCDRFAQVGSISCNLALYRVGLLCPSQTDHFERFASSKLKCLSSFSYGLPSTSTYG